MSSALRSRRIATGRERTPMPAGPQAEAERTALALEGVQRPAGPQPEAERAALALEGVERDLEKLREQRHRLDVAEAGMWQRRNQLEEYLIGALGTDWWRARRRRAGREADGTTRDGDR